MQSGPPRAARRRLPLSAVDLLQNINVKIALGQQLLELPSYFGDRAAIGFAQDRHHLFIGKSTLSHRLLVEEEPSFQKLSVRKSRRRSAARAEEANDRVCSTGGEDGEEINRYRFVNLIAPIVPKP